jgi:hypothetical protein
VPIDLLTQLLGLVCGDSHGKSLRAEFHGCPCHC